jgi:hypothetical protein
MKTKDGMVIVINFPSSMRVCHGLIANPNVVVFKVFLLTVQAHILTLVGVAKHSSSGSSVCAQL